MSDGSAAAPLVLALLPACNATVDLPGYLESVARFADGVVALDDGSTDDTRAVLESHDFVRTVLTNPTRYPTTGAGTTRPTAIGSSPRRPSCSPVG